MASKALVYIGIAIAVIAMGAAIAYGTLNQENYVSEGLVLAPAADQGSITSDSGLGSELNREQWHEDPFGDIAQKVRENAGAPRTEAEVEKKSEMEGMEAEMEGMEFEMEMKETEGMKSEMEDMKSEMEDMEPETEDMEAEMEDMKSEMEGMEAEMEEPSGPQTVSIDIPSGTSVPGCEETNECWTPSSVTINAGDTVEWTNSDTAAHTVTGGLPADGPSGVFDSSLVLGGAAYAFTFEEAGNYDYFCMVHPWMVGDVQVN